MEKAVGEVFDFNDVKLKVKDTCREAWVSRDARTVTKQYACPVSIIYDCYFNIVI